MKTHTEAKNHTPSRVYATPSPNALANQAQLRKALRQAGVQPPLEVGAADDALEREAEHIAEQVSSLPLPTARGGTPTRIQRLRGDNSASARKAAPPSVECALAGAGQALEPSVRQSMEQRLGYDFSCVRVHTDSEANASAQSIGAQAYTAGSQIVFAAGKYSPNTMSGQHLLAHELVHVMQQAGTPQRVQRRRHQANAGQTEAERPDYVFIMGPQSDKFYKAATGYFRAHHPEATRIYHMRRLEDVLSYVANNVSEPIGNLYLVVHAAEDGTLALGDKDNRPSVTSLRKALHPEPGQGASQLAELSRQLRNSEKKQIDSKTMIRIKGCNLGRTEEMIHLLDEAFGGAGTVIAPTHEQGFGEDSNRVTQAEAEFRAEVAARHPEPAAVDETLTGKEAQAARAARTRAMQERDKAIAAEMRERSAELKLHKARAQYVEFLGGPMFQRPGEKLYTEEELMPELKRLYGHLSDEKLQELESKLVTPVKSTNSIIGQKGQCVHREELKQPYEYPQDDSGFLVLLAKKVSDKKSDLYGFKRTGAPPEVTQETTQDGWIRNYHFQGTQNNQQWNYTLTYRLPNDDTYLLEAKQRLNNPDRYEWGLVLSTYNKGVTTLAVVATRVIAYLHYGSLNVEAKGKPTTYFYPSESDADFFTSSK